MAADRPTFAVTFEPGAKYLRIHKGTHGRDEERLPGAGRHDGRPARRLEREVGTVRHRPRRRFRGRRAGGVLRRGEDARRRGSRGDPGSEVGFLPFKVEPSGHYFRIDKGRERPRRRDAQAGRQGPALSTGTGGSPPSTRSSPSGRPRASATSRSSSRGSSPRTSRTGDITGYLDQIIQGSGVRQPDAGQHRHGARRAAVPLPGDLEGLRAAAARPDRLRHSGRQHPAAAVDLQQRVALHDRPRVARVRVQHGRQQRAGHHLLRRARRRLSAADLPRHRRHDRLLGAAVEPQEPAAGRGRANRHLPDLHRRAAGSGSRRRAPRRSASSAAPTVRRRSSPPAGWRPR